MRFLTFDRVSNKIKDQKCLLIISYFLFELSATLCHTSMKRYIECAMT